MDAADQIQAQVRARYAAAAVAVTTSGQSALAVVDGDLRCRPANDSSSLEVANAACCGGGGAAGVSFGAGLYEATERDELPADAIAASPQLWMPWNYRDAEAS